MESRDHVVLVIDVEATCWQGPVPPGEQNEVIEIGICELDAVRRERLSGESILVRPKRSKVGAFCTELTTLTQAEVDAGIPFEAACARLREQFRSGETVWASYGAYDRNQFRRQCASFGVEYPFGAAHINVKARFAEAFGLHRAVGMAGALRLLKIPLHGTHHRGGDDAWNIAAVLGWMLERRPIEELISRDDT